MKDIGLISANLLGIVVTRRIGLKWSLAAAVALAAGACAVLVFARDAPSVYVGTFGHGAAFGLGSLCAVTAMYRLDPRYRRLSLLYALFGVASFLAPALVGATVRDGRNYHTAYLVYGVALLPVLAWAAVSRVGDGRGKPAKTPERPPLRRLLSAAFLRRAVLYGLIMVGETIPVVWLTSLLQYTYHYSLRRASASLALFWVAHTVGRAVGDFWSRRFGELRAVAFAGTAAAVGLMLVLLGGVAAVTGGLTLLAFAVAPMVPLFQSYLLSTEDGQLHEGVNGMLSVSGALGATLFVWLTGFLIDVNGRLPFAFTLVLLVGIVGVTARWRRGQAAVAG